MFVTTPYCFLVHKALYEYRPNVQNIHTFTHSHLHTQFTHIYMCCTHTYNTCICLVGNTETQAAMHPNSQTHDNITQTQSQDCLNHISCTHTHTYSATKQESKTFQNHYFWLKFAQMCLLITRMATTTIYIAFYKTSFFPYIANREAIYVQSTFQAFFAIFG